MIETINSVVGLIQSLPPGTSMALAAAPAAAGGFFGWMAARSSKPADMQTVLNKSFTDLLEQFRVSLSNARDEITVLTLKVSSQAAEINALNTQTLALTTALQAAQNGRSIDALARAFQATDFGQKPGTVTSVTATTQTVTE